LEFYFRNAAFSEQKTFLHPFSLEAKILVGQSQISLENSRYKVALSSNSGLLETLKLKGDSSRETVNLQHSFQQYPTTSSGAYIFRPSGDAEQMSASFVTIRKSQGPVFQRVQVHFGAELLVSYTLVQGSGSSAWHLEVIESLIADRNKEVTSRFFTNIGTENSTPDNSASKFLTHNGAEYVNRPIRFSEVCPNAQSSFFPTVLGARILSHDTRLTVLSSHTTAASSPKPGALEFMVHRNLVQDDGRGLGEPPEDGSRIQVKFLLLLETIKDGLLPLHLRRARFGLNSELLVLSGNYLGSSSSIACEAALVCKEMLKNPSVDFDEIHLTLLRIESRMSDRAHLLVENVNSKGTQRFSMDELFNPSLDLKWDQVKETSLSKSLCKFNLVRKNSL
jgi:hypothetical protein